MHFKRELVVQPNTQVLISLSIESPAKVGMQILPSIWGNIIHLGFFELRTKSGILELINGKRILSRPVFNLHEDAL